MRALLAIAAACACAAAQTPAPAVDFQKTVWPILNNYCVGCHNASKASGGLAFTSREAVIKSGALKPGAPEQSPLYTLLELPPTQHGAMPPGGPQLSPASREIIHDWIAAGASWPAGTGAAAARAVTADPVKAEHDLVSNIHEAILKKRSQPFAAYHETIPGTSVSYDMAPIRAGEFTMGTPPTEKGHQPDESPQHKVKLDAFWMQAHEVTWDEYRLFMFENQAQEAPKDATVDAVSRPTRPYMEMSFGMGINGFPAISMTQHAANKYAEWLSAKTGEFYRLPTEAEWEYACRAGTETAYAWGNDAAQLGEYAWYAANSGGKYQKVATKKPNAWGLYDMNGNVMEWTLDQYLPNFYSKNANGVSVDPWAKATEPYPHSVRGGSWNDSADVLRCGARMHSDPSWKQQDPQIPKSIWYMTDAQWLGFRLVRPAKVPSTDEMYQYWNSGVEKE